MALAAENGCHSAAGALGPPAGAQLVHSAPADATQAYREAFAAPRCRKRPFIAYWRLETADDIQLDGEVNWISREAFLVAALRAIPRIREVLGKTSLYGVRIAHYMSANRIEDAVLRLSAALSGYSLVTINWDADSIERIKYKVIKTKCAAVVYDEGVPKERVDRLLREVSVHSVQAVPTSRLVHHEDFLEPGTANLDVEFAVLNSSSENFAKEPERQAPCPTAERMIVFTSGTTSDPKGVRLSYGNLEISCRSILDAIGATDETAVDLVVVNPFHHVNSSVMVELCLRYPNVRIHLIDRYRTTFWKVLLVAARRSAAEAKMRHAAKNSEGNSNDDGWEEGFRVVVPLVSRHIDFLQSLSSKKQFRDEHFLDSLKDALKPKGVILFLGSAPVGPSTVNALNKLLGKLPKVRFGSTETALQVAAIPFVMSDGEELKALEKGWSHKVAGVPKPGYYIGRPHRCLTEMRVVRSVKPKDKGYMIDCEEGEPGFLVCRGGNTMLGYANADSYPFCNEGWYLGFGDIGFFLIGERDGEKDYYWVSREGDILIKGGANYSCEQIANELLPFLCDTYKLPKESVSLVAIGIKWRSEHDDDVCITVELPEEFLEKKTAIESDFVQIAASSSSIFKGSKPDFVRVASIPKTFKGAVNTDELKKGFMQFLEEHAADVKRPAVNGICL